MHVKLLGIAASATLCMTLTIARAQQPSTLRAEIASVVAGDYPAARAVVNIDDTATGGVKTLTADNFTVTVGGKPAPVFSADLASSQNAPLDLLLLMDVSGSMAGDPIAQTKEAAKGLLQALASGDRVAVMSFADTVNLVQDYSTDRAQTTAAIDGLIAKGNTALYDATGSAAYRAGSSGSSRRAVILLSDGAQDGVTVKTTREEALAAAVGVSVPYFAVGEGIDIDRAYLTELATSTNGRYLEAPKATDLSGLFASIAQLLTSQFIVSFDARVAAGAAETPVMITVQSDGASVTAQATFKPGAGFAPPPISVSLTGVKQGESLSEARLVTAVPYGATGVTRIAFYVDGVNVFETDKAPYTFTFDPKSFGATSHTLKATVIAGATSFESPPVSFTSHPPVAARSGGGGLPLVPIAVGVAGLIVLAVVGRIAMIVRARLTKGGEVVVVSADQRITPWVARHRALDAPAPELAEAPVVVVEDVGEPLGVLISRVGPLTGSEYIVGGKPVSIGSGTRCAVRIADPSLPAEEARIWVRDGHLMLHRMTRLTDIAADGVSGGWTILQPGDHLDIGDHRFEFRLWTPPAPQTEEGSADIPNILRDAGVPHPAPGQRPSVSPAPAGLGALWPADTVARGGGADSRDRDALAS